VKIHTVDGLVRNDPKSLQMAYVKLHVWAWDLAFQRCQFVHNFWLHVLAHQAGIVGEQRLCLHMEKLGRNAGNEHAPVGVERHTRNLRSRISSTDCTSGSAFEMA
jgi:hypothetical protein